MPWKYIPQFVNRNQSNQGSRAATRRLVAESLESRCLLAADLGFDASLLALDVTGDNAITPLDVLSLTNEINRGGVGAANLQEGRSRAALDVNRDGFVTPLDSLHLVNHLNRYGNRLLSVAQQWSEDLPRISEAQKENLQQLLTDLNRLRVRSEITPEQVVQIVEDAVASVGDATRLDRFERILSGLRPVAAAHGVSREDIQVIAGTVRGILDEFRTDRPEIEHPREEVRQLIDQLVDFGRELPIPVERVRQLGADIAALADSARAPDPATLIALARDVRDAIEDRQVSDSERAAVAESVDAVFASAGISRDQVHVLATEVESILEAVLPLRDELPPLLENLTTIGLELLGRHRMLSQDA